MAGSTSLTADAVIASEAISVAGNTILAGAIIVGANIALAGEGAGYGAVSVACGAVDCINAGETAVVAGNAFIIHSIMKCEVHAVT